MQLCNEVQLGLLVNTCVTLQYVVRYYSLSYMQLLPLGAQSQNSHFPPYMGNIKAINYKKALQYMAGKYICILYYIIVKN